MNTFDHSPAEPELCSVEELEARFEMEAVPHGAVGVTPGLDWKCGCTFEF